MRILLLTAGSHGDVHPFLALAQSLQSRNHHVALLTNPYFQPDALAADIPFLPHGQHIDLPTFIRDMHLMHPTRGPRNVFRWIFNNTPQLLSELDATLTSFKPDLVVHHMICFGTPWLCERRGIPAVSCCLQPAVWFSEADPVPAMQREPDPRDARTSRFIARTFKRPALAMGSWKMNRLRLACGYPKQRDAIVDAFRGGPLSLGLWSPSFRPPMPDDPPASRITGFPLFDGGEHRPMPNDLSRFLDNGPPPLIFALGTTAVHVAGDFYRHAAQVCQCTNSRGVLLCGKSANVPANLPPGIIAVPYAPFSKVMPRAALSVVHGGIGSVAQALAAGKPTIVTPFSHDQFNNGVRVQRLGVGFTLGRRRLTVERLQQAIQAALADPSIATRAAALGQTISAEHGADQAAQAIESFARHSTPLQPLQPAPAPRYQQTETTT